MFNVIDEMRWLVRGDYQLVFSNDLPTGLNKSVQKEFIHRQAIGDIDEDEEFVNQFVINSDDQQGKNLILLFKRSFAASLILYDNYTVVMSLYHKNSKIRRLLNFDNSDSIYFLEKITKSYVSPANRRSLAESVAAIKKMPTTIDGKYFEELINSSSFYQIFNTPWKNKNEVDVLTFYQNSISDHLHRVAKVSTYGLSKFFGNSMGLFASRKGKMWGLSKRELSHIEKKLKPLDILLEKTPFRLTDKFIPGHYGHVAIWLGNEKELKEVGLWNHEVVLPYHKDIRAGKKVLEALRPGVELNTLHHFMNIDDFAVLRYKSIDLNQKIDYLKNSFRQIGKTYDFNFDVETDKRIVCSELAYVVYDDMIWPTEKALGRITISPDNVAVKALDDGPFKVTMIYHDGKEINHRLQKNFSHLLNLEYDQIKY